MYRLKVLEELKEIEKSEHKDVREFADLLQVIICFAKANGIPQYLIENLRSKKFKEKGGFTNIVINKLSEHNPSDNIYFDYVNNQLNVKNKDFVETDDNDWSKLARIATPAKWLEMYGEYQDIILQQDVAGWWQEQFMIADKERQMLKEKYESTNL